MAGHSGPKDGVASLAYARPSTSQAAAKEVVDARDKPGHDELMCWLHATPANAAPDLKRGQDASFCRRPAPGFNRKFIGSELAPGFSRIGIAR
jgi:hypothetical protein